MSSISKIKMQYMHLMEIFWAIASFLAIALVAWIPMTQRQQFLFGLIVVVACVTMGSLTKARYATHFMMTASVGVSVRYIWWRIHMVYAFSHGYPQSSSMTRDLIFMVILLAAEVYSVLVLLLGHFQSVAPLQRRPYPLPANKDSWPRVDIFIPTYNEPLELVRSTVLAATELEWPREKLRVVILDDGGRDEFRLFAKTVGVDYVARARHDHAKAGNINHALLTSRAEFVTIFDCDHVPTRNFLLMTMGWMLRDEKIGLLQTPHHFYSPDPIERNLGLFRTVPNEGELFYGVIQDGNDLWNATFFCGSCAILRRAALDEIGGIAVESVSEDAHTSLRMQMKGWNTAYLNIVLSAGLATESVAAHVNQRVRWARGMIQILRMDNPLFSKGLGLAQRFCYLNSMLHFMYAAPRLIFLLSPLTYLFFGQVNIPGRWLTILTYAMPHLILAIITNSRLQGHKRHSFWSEVYETILSPFILLPTWLAMFNPRLGKFNVTQKGSRQDGHFDSSIARPFLLLLLLNLAGAGMAVMRYLYWNTDHRDTVIVNAIWALFNMIILGVTVAVCLEERQRRGSVRIAASIPVRIGCDGQQIDCFSRDMSSTGLAVHAQGYWMPDQQVTLTFPEVQDYAPVRASVAGSSNEMVRFRFNDLEDVEQLRTITSVLYSNASRWKNWNTHREDDQILISFLRILRHAMRGMALAAFYPLESFAKRTERKKRAVTATVPVMILCALLSSSLAWTRAVPSTSLTENDTEVKYALNSSRSHEQILLNRQNPVAVFRSVLPSAFLLKSGTLQISYNFPQNSRPEDVTLLIGLNGNEIASLTPESAELAAGSMHAEFPLPADSLIQDNRLTIELPSVEGALCTRSSDKAPSLWVRLDPGTLISFRGSRIHIAQDLGLLPEPFTHPAAGSNEPINLVFAGRPDRKILQASGITASWFGLKTQDHSARFRTFIDRIPQGNAVIFLVGTQSIEGVSSEGNAALSLLKNPKDPYGFILLFHAPDGEQLIHLAQAFSLGQIRLQGTESQAAGMTMPAMRRANDAPTWIQTNRIPLAQLAGASSLASSATTPAELYLRFAPDLYFGAENRSYLSLNYTTGVQPLTSTSNIAVSMNQLPIDSMKIHSLATNAMQSAEVSLDRVPYVFRSSLRIRVYPLLLGSDACTSIGSSYGGSINGNTSYVDLGGARHAALLPSLKLFTNAGYPFTRYADLSQTAVLLPESVSEDGIALYLNLMAHFGAQTGYPAIRVSVGYASQAEEYRDKDILLLGTYADGYAAGRLLSKLPVTPWSDGHHIAWLARLKMSLYRLLPFLGKEAAPSEEDVDASSGIVTSAESSYKSHRTVVAILVKNAATLPTMTSGLIDILPFDTVHGDLSLWNGESFQSYRVGISNYLLSDLNWFEKAQIRMTESPWIPAVILLLFAAAAAFWARIWTQFRIYIRLKGADRTQTVEVQG